MNADEIVATLALLGREIRGLEYKELLQVDEAHHLLGLDIEKEMEEDNA